MAGGLAKALPKTKYDEDVFEMGHTQVWGSFSKVVDGEVVWGYACCGGNHHHSPQESIRAVFSKDFNDSKIISKDEARIFGRVFQKSPSG